MDANRRDAGARPPERNLPAIPLLDTRGKGPAALVDMAPERVAAIIAHGRRSYGGLALRTRGSRHVAVADPRGQPLPG